MSTALSQVSICNQAISWLGGTLITSLDDESTEAVLCKANYDLLKDNLLESHNWSFALARATLVPDVNTPVFGYTYQFTIPSGVLRIIKPIGTPAYEKITDWEIEGGYILANESELYIRYVTSIEDPQKFSFLFAQALSARIAAEIARPLTHSASLAKEMWSLFSIKLGEAVASDTLQTSTVQTGDGAVVNARLSA